jgi:hypothetical protein
MSSLKIKINVRGSGHGLHFWAARFVKYRDTCLELGGYGYDQLDKYYDVEWHPFRLPGPKRDQS